MEEKFKIYVLILSVLFSYVLGGVEGTDLIVGMELSYPPFETVDRQGNPWGFSVDLAEALGKDLDRHVVIKNIPFVGLIPSLKTGKIDLIISSLSITPLRQESIDFSIPYLEVGLCLLVSRQSNLQGIEEANQPGRVIAVKQGTSGEVYARKHLPKATILTLDKEASCVLEVVQGRADVFIYDQFSVYTNWKKNQETTRAILKPFHIEQWAIGVRKGNQVLLNQVNVFLTKFKKEKQFKELAEYYLTGPIQAFKELGVPFHY